MSDIDKTFYDRADAHIHLANDQVCDESPKGKVSASFLYGAARFNAWAGACSCDSANDMQQNKDNMLEYYCDQYRKVLEENIDDYIENFEDYLGRSADGT